MTESAHEASAGDTLEVAALAAAARAELVDQRGGELWTLREDRGPLTADRVRTLLEDPHHLVLVGSYEGVTLGYAVVHLEDLVDGSLLAVVDELYVDAAARGVGVGEALMDLVLERARALGCRGVDALALPGNRAAKNFFERFGLTARAILVHRALDGAPGGERREP